MKRYRFFYGVVFVSLLFISCSKIDNTEYYQVLGTLIRTNDSTIIVGDDDERFLVDNAGSLSSIDDDDRVIVYFSLIEEQLPQGIDYIISVYDYTDVLYKPVIILTEENADSIGNDPLTVRDIWVIKDFLNLNFQFMGYDEVHMINLTRQPDDISADTINLEIRHNNYDDRNDYVKSGFVTFDLRSLQTVGADSVVLHVKANEYDSKFYDKYFTYKFN